MGEIDKIIQEISPYYKKRKAPSREHRLVYDSSTETLEPVYFWILDFMNDRFGGKVEKIFDNFASSPGSGHFSELQGKASQMQQEASRVLGTVNNILKGVMNLIYDIKEFKIRLSQYEKANSKDPSESQAGMLSLKQVWMDKVDIQRGQGSINAMSAGNLQFVTLRDAFMAVESLKQIDKLDLNERVIRVLKPRIQEFFEWKERSYQELKKRLEIEKIYLKSQVAALKLNARWAKPYLRAAEQLSSNERLGKNPALVSIFNTVILDLTIMGRNPLDVKGAVESGQMPKDFKNIKKLREYNAVVFIEFNFRGIPQRPTAQHWAFGGRVEVKFKAYCLNEDEILLMRNKLDDSDLESALKLIQGMTDDSIGQLKIDIDEILGEEEKKVKKTSEDINPFSALFSFSEILKKKEEKEKDKLEELKAKGMKAENYVEKYLRKFAELNSIEICFNIYDIYKKSHGMAAFPYGGTPEVPDLPKSKAEKLFGFK